jgi:hypothetical protein
VLCYNEDWSLRPSETEGMGIRTYVGIGVPMVLNLVPSVWEPKTRCGKRKEVNHSRDRRLPTLCRDVAQSHHKPCPSGLSTEDKSVWSSRIHRYQMFYKGCPHHAASANFLHRRTAFGPLLDRILLLLRID